MDIRLGESNRIVSPQMHDSRIVKAVLTGGSLDLFCEPEAGRPFVLTLEGVEDIVLTDIMEGCIVLDAAISNNGETASEWLMQSLLQLLHMYDATQRATKVNRVRSGELLHFWTGSSYGMLVQALCRRISVKGN